MRSNVLFITGCAPCAHDDIAAARQLGDGDWMAIGLDAVDLYAWPIKYVATYHPVDVPEIYQRRAAIGGNTDFQVIGHIADPDGARKPENGIHISILNWWKPSGSSALLGVQAALEQLGYDRIIVCGCPLEGKNNLGTTYTGFRKGWEEHKDKLHGRVKAMSGWTRDFLGAPTVEWING